MNDSHDRFDHTQLSHDDGYVWPMTELSRADVEILRRLHDYGSVTQGYLVSETEYSRTHIHQRLKLLERSGWVKNIHENTALWTLTDEAPEPPYEITETRGGADGDDEQGSDGDQDSD